MNPELKQMTTAIQHACQTTQALSIAGDNSKSFMGSKCDAPVFCTKAYSGVVSYEPSELVITAKAGTPVQQIQAELAQHQQMLAFEPPVFSAGSTIGGVIAAGLSGPRRPYAGSVRDYVLGVQCINGRGELLHFGGQVIKNVAGYDLSRLLTGSFGTLAVITEMSIRVAPQPQYEISYSMEMQRDKAFDELQQWIMAGLPISASAYYQQQLMIRLSGHPSAIEKMAQQCLPTERKELVNSIWQQLNYLQHDFFTNGDLPLWCLHIPAQEYGINIDGECLIDWGGARIWLRSALSAADIRQQVTAVGGHADLIHGELSDVERFHPLSPALKKYHQRIKQAFDPKNILNPGRMYQTF